jgi:hypothetical protein
LLDPFAPLHSKEKGIGIQEGMFDWQGPGAGEIGRLL